MYVEVSTKDEIRYTLNDMLGDAIITLISLEAVIEYAEEKKMHITNLHKFV